MIQHRHGWLGWFTISSLQGARLSVYLSVALLLFAFCLLSRKLHLLITVKAKECSFGVKTPGHVKSLPPTYRTRHTMKERGGEGGVVNLITITLSAHDTWFCKKYLAACYTLKYFSHPLGRLQRRLLFSPLLSSSPLIATRKVSHTWVSHVKQLIPWNTPFKWVFWSVGLPIVMKRSVSSHVSLAQVPALPAHQIIAITRDGETDTDYQIGREGTVWGTFRWR